MNIRTHFYKKLAIRSFCSHPLSETTFSLAGASLYRCFIMLDVTRKGDLRLGCDR
jgi:addiction module HigA family antidote